MKKTLSRPNDDTRENKAGFALVLTLLVLVMLTVLVVGFNAATRTEQIAARNFSYQGVASQMADMAVNRGLALLNMTVTNSVVTQPGRAWSSDAGDVQLSSAALGGGASLVNLNTWQAGTNATNYFIATNTTTAFFQVPFIEARVSNVPVGRYAFWIDDDGSKMNLNATWTNARADFLPTNARPYSLLVFTSFPNLSLANLSVSNFSVMVTTNTTNRTLGWSYFFTPRQLMMLSGLNIGTYQKLMFHATGGPGNQARGTFVLAPNNEPAALDAGSDSGMLSVYGNANYRGDLDALENALNRVASSYLASGNYNLYFGQGRHFLAKYSSNVARQIIANINDAALPASAESYTGATAINMLSGPNSTDENMPVPRSVLGLRPTPYLNEVAVAVVQCTNFPPGGIAGGPAELQVWMHCELVDPYQTGLGADWAIKYKIQDLEFSGTYVLNGVTNNFSNPTNSIGWNWDGGLLAVTNSGPIPPNSYHVPTTAFAFEWQAGGVVPAGASNVVFTTVSVRPSLALLLVSGTNFTTVRDWAFGDDFPGGHFVFNNPPVVTAPLGFNGYGAFPPGAVTFGPSIAKNDPRVRRFADYEPPLPAWQARSTNSLGVANPTFNPVGGTGISGVGNDPVTGVTDIFNHPSFAPVSGSILPSWTSVFDLSRIHTGLQWRTLQLRAQDASEAAVGVVPDWALLEAFTVSNNPAPVVAKLNVNSLPYPAAAGATNQASLRALLEQGMARPLAVAGLFAGNTNAASATAAAINGVNLGIPTNSVFLVSGTNSYLAVASNIARLDFSPSWRQNRPAALPPNALGMLAEVLEINGISNFTNNEAANEGRARGFYDALAASSDVFTIFSVGQALDRNGDVTGETFRRTQVARDPANPARFKVIFTEPLIWE